MADVEQPNQSPSFWKFIGRLLQTYGGPLLLLWLGVAVPLFLFTQLAIAIWEQKEGLIWDVPILLNVHAMANPTLDQWVPFFTRLGGFGGGAIWGTLIGVVLLIQRQWRSFLYLFVTLGGAIVINRVAKTFFHRLRPSLWTSLAPETNFAFPSGHASTSMTIVAILIVLTWGTRYFWLSAFAGAGFVLGIGWTRLYLGVHFPSDILAGWLISLAWAIGVSLVIRPHQIQPSPETEDKLTLTEKSATGDL